MRPVAWARKTHKWIALLVGAQAILWMVSGLFMTAVSINAVRGDGIARARTQAAPLSAPARWLDSRALAAAVPGLTGWRLKRLLGHEVFEVQQSAGTDLLDAHDGRRLTPLNEITARALARALYLGDAPIASARLLTRAPREVSTRAVPLWRIDFADRTQTSLYLSPQTGELLARRQRLWRWYDFLWMLHIMDYAQRTDVNNNLLRIAGTAGLVFSLSGVWLLFYSFKRRPRR